MSAPSTPRKKNGDGVNQIVHDLNIKWGLDIPVKTVMESPAKAAKSKERQVWSAIRELFFRRMEALLDALLDFENRAKYLESGWTFKPRAEPDVLPSIAVYKSVLPQPPLVRRDDQVQKLTDVLLECLERAKKALYPPTPSSSRVKYPFLPTPGQPAVCAGLRVDANANVLPDRNPEPAVANVANKPVSYISLGRVEPSSPGEFALTQGTREAMAEFTTQPEEDEDGSYETAPQLALGESSGSSTDEDAAMQDAVENLTPNEVFFAERADMTRFSRRIPTVSKKRNIEAVTAEPRKVPREGLTYQPMVYGVNHPEANVFTGHRMTESRNTSFSTAFPSTRTSPATSFTESMNCTSTINSIDRQLFAELGYSNQQRLTDVHIESELDKRIDKPIVETEACLTAPGLKVATARLLQDPLDEFAKLFRRYLVEESPFVSPSKDLLQSLSFQETYEITRAALHCQTPVPAFASQITGPWPDYASFWTSMQPLVGAYRKNMPEKSKAAAWQKAEEGFEGVVLSGQLTFNEKRGDPILGLNLQPLCIERTFRLSRKYGSDRFLILGLPGLDENDLPSYLRHQANTVRGLIIDWLVQTDHSFLGRTWRAFYRKKQPSTSTARKQDQGKFNAIKHRLYFFATNGHDFGSPKVAKKTANHAFVSVDELLGWFMPADQNVQQSSLKFFARIALGLSNTIPTVVFKPHQIIRTYDAESNIPRVRRLDLDRCTGQPRQAPSEPKPSIMNDGCARISRSAARQIAIILGLTNVPSVFQARIAGAKGVWMIDPLDEKYEGNEELWIEITESQTKFQSHLIDASHPDPLRVTFEVNTWSSALTAADLNSQLIPILVHCRVPPAVFTKLLKEDLTLKIDELEEAMTSGLALRKWTQDKNPASSERATYGKILTFGGLPQNNTEKINWFVEHGFEPTTCQIFMDECYNAVTTHCDALRSRLNIGIGRSTYALMIADPLAVLEEDEVHIGFSDSFKDNKSGFNDTMLHDIDVLVARIPAHLPSDIQKVRAVFKPELRMFKDVVIFSSKGRIPLAEKLSGGDYDGDRAWICWEPDVVGPFQNAEPPAQPSPDYYGIVKDSTTISDIIGLPGFTTLFIRSAFEFNLQSSILGLCTVYHESYCYHDGSINSPTAKAIGSLLGYLVDSAKGGLKYTDEMWKSFLKSQRLRPQLKSPAYKRKDKDASCTSHILDQLVLKVLPEAIKAGLPRFTKHFALTSSWDPDLVRVWNAEDTASRSDPGLGELLRDLCNQLKRIHESFIAKCPPQSDSPAAMTRAPARRGATLAADLETARDAFLALPPLETSTHPLAVRWRADEGSTKGAWTRLKASALYHLRPKGKVVWWICAKELGELKVLARGDARSVIEGIHLVMKLDGKMMARMAKTARLAQEWQGEGWGEGRGEGKGKGAHPGPADGGMVDAGLELEAFGDDEYGF